MNEAQFIEAVREILWAPGRDKTAVDLGGQHAAIHAAAQEFAAHMIELYARPGAERYDNLPVAACVEREHIGSRLRALITEAPKDLRSGQRYVSAERIGALLRELGVPVPNPEAI